MPRKKELFQMEISSLNIGGIDGDEHMLKAKVIDDNEGQSVLLPKKIYINGMNLRVRIIGSVVILIPIEKSISTFVEEINDITTDYSGTV